MEKFKTILNNVEAEIVEKKSKFIAHIFYVETPEEADNYIKEIKKKYHDARHNCYAYKVIENLNIIERSSDDGEPSGTDADRRQIGKPGQPAYIDHRASAGIEKDKKNQRSQRQPGRRAGNQQRNQAKKQPDSPAEKTDGEHIFFAAVRPVHQH